MIIIQSTAFSEGVSCFYCTCSVLSYTVPLEYSYCHIVGLINKWATYIQRPKAQSPSGLMIDYFPMANFGMLCYSAMHFLEMLIILIKIKVLVISYERMMNENNSLYVYNSYCSSTYHVKYVLYVYMSEYVS